MQKSLKKYFELLKDRPELFIQIDGQLTIELNTNTIQNYINEHGVAIGVVYDSDYNMMLVDLVHNGDKKYFTYERLIPKSKGISTVMITSFEDKFVVLKQFRHAMRDFQYAFPRGYGTDGLIGEENAKKELLEEIRAEVQTIKKLGRVMVDSGITSNAAEIYYCEVSNMQVQKGYEEIDDYVLLDLGQLHEWIKMEKISDSFSIIAFYLYLERIHQNQILIG